MTSTPKPHAFAQGYTVYWFPSRGVAKQWHRRACLHTPYQTSDLVPCSLKEAKRWQGPGFEPRVQPEGIGLWPMSYVKKGYVDW